VKFQASARRTRHLDQQVGRIGRQRVAGQRGLGDVDRSIHHLEAAQLRNFRSLVDLIEAVQVSFGRFDVDIV
jgi:hypothetical protein